MKSNRSASCVSELYRSLSSRSPRMIRFGISRPQSRTSPSSTPFVLRQCFADLNVGRLFALRQ